MIESKGQGSTRGYTVEVRCEQILDPSRPPQLHDGIVTTEWRTVSFDRSGNPAGVPGIDGLDGVFGMFGMTCLPYDSAVALAHTIIAQNPHRGLECRIVGHEQKYTYENKRLGAVDMPAIKSNWASRPGFLTEEEA